MVLKIEGSVQDEAKQSRASLVFSFTELQPLIVEEDVWSPFCFHWRTGKEKGATFSNVQVQLVFHAPLFNSGDCLLELLIGQFQFVAGCSKRGIIGKEDNLRVVGNVLTNVVNED